jgi:hypothetical protein
MTAPPVVEYRARPGGVRLGGAGEPVIALRVEVPEVWDVVRVEAPPATPVAVVKQRALEELVPDFSNSDEWVVKLRGFEVLDESVTLTDAGAKNGSTFLITNRHRKPVK